MSIKRRGVSFLLALTLLFSIGYTSRAEALNGVSKAADQNQTGQALAETAWADDPFSLLFHQFYLDAAGIKVHYQSERAAMGDKIRKALETEPVHVNLEKGGLFEREYFGLTRNNYSQYLYYGKLKDNRPSGFGVLTVEDVDPDNMETFWALVYAGGFKTGRYDGYGAKFALQYKEFDNSSDMQRLVRCIQSGILSDDEASYMPAIIYLTSYVDSDGNWSQGKLNGKVNRFQIRMSESLQGDFWGDVCYPNIYVTNAKRGVQNGDTKWYIGGALYYDGAMKAFSKNGTGTTYYENGKKEYEGKWRNGKYNGYGKLYDENGELIYSGKWKNGDYAS